MYVRYETKNMRINYRSQRHWSLSFSIGKWRRTIHSFKFLHMHGPLGRRAYVVKYSETPTPLCILCPWQIITQYTHFVTSSFETSDHSITTRAYLLLRTSITSTYVSKTYINTDTRVVIHIELLWHLQIILCLESATSNLTNHMESERERQS